MLNKLHLKNCFVHRDVTFEFRKGLTSIVGANESGKSLIVEMVRYALFGSAALRGKAEDYKQVEVTLEFVVRGQTYSVYRKGAKAELDGPDKASGTRPVNAAIIALLGYDLKVFDVANACNQGDIEKLTNMLPAERKAMVDQTVGLNILDKVIAFCGEQGNALRREAAAFESALVEPTAPTEPDGYVPSKDIDLSTARANVAEYNQLQGLLSAAPDAPAAPEALDLPPMSELQEAQAHRDKGLRLIKEWQAENARLEPETHTSEELDAMVVLHDLADLWDQKQKLLARGENECPSCGHHWPLAADQLVKYAEVEEVTRPSLTQRQIMERRDLIGNDLILNRNADSIADWAEALDRYPDQTASITARRRHDAAMASYEASLAAYEAYNSKLGERQARFQELEGCKQTVMTLEGLQQLSRDYERDLTRYTADKAAYDEAMVTHTSLTDRSEKYLAARTAVQDLKTRVKQHLLPPLNRVSSQLLSQMTGGERSWIDVSPDFEITVDGQAVNTLSGSGKAVANLAVRIALGQILTSRTFSVFFADEVDASMDKERAAYTAQALNRLKETIAQVIQVTHQRPETEHRIELTS